MPKSAFSFESNFQNVQCHLAASDSPSLCFKWAIDAVESNKKFN